MVEGETLDPANLKETFMKTLPLVGLACRKALVIALSVITIVWPFANHSASFDRAIHKGENRMTTKETIQG